MRKIIILIIILSVFFVCCKQRPLNLVDVDTQTFTFITLNDTIHFSPSQKDKLDKIFEKADSLVCLSIDSTFYKYLGIIDSCYFTYHHLYIENSKLTFNYIIINDSVNNKEIYINKVESFVANLLKYSNLYYEQDVR